MAVDYRALAAQYARQAGFQDPSVFVRQIAAESGFNPSADSPAGAHGIAQIVPKYHPDAPPESDPAGQLRWAAKYMAGLVRKYGSYAKALSVYNSGRPDAYKDPNFAHGETYNYVRKILGGGAALDARLARTKTQTTEALGAALPALTEAPTASQGPSSRANLLAYVMANGQRFAKGESPLSVLSFMEDQEQPKQQMAPPDVAPQFASMQQAGSSSAPAPSANGLNPDFASKLKQLEKSTGVTIGSGFRDVKEQTVLWNNALKKYGSVAEARKWVAPPGHSNHNKGLAADLHGTPQQIAAAHKLAPQLGLNFPLSNEPWHIEPIGIR